jgi:hypothetical protein
MRAWLGVMFVQLPFENVFPATPARRRATRAPRGLIGVIGIVSAIVPVAAKSCGRCQP